MYIALDHFEFWLTIFYVHFKWPFLNTFNVQYVNIKEKYLCTELVKVKVKSKDSILNMNIIVKATRYIEQYQVPAQQIRQKTVGYLDRSLTEDPIINHVACSQ